MIFTEIIIILLSWLGRFGYIEVQQEATWLPGSLVFPCSGAEGSKQMVIKLYTNWIEVNLVSDK